MRAASRLLLLEADALPTVLSRARPEDFERPTPCPGWSVRDVLAHCGAALGGLVKGTVGSFTPEDNDREVELRRGWPLAQVLAELYDNYGAAAEIIDRLDGRGDGLGLGEWVHGGDVRDPLGEPDAYASAGIELALPLISARSVELERPELAVTVDGETVPFGVGAVAGSGPVGTLDTDAATFVRLVSGRLPDPARYRLDGVATEELLLFS